MKRLFAVILALAMIFALTGCASSDYSNAAKSFESGDYAAAGEIFKALADYKDSAERADECDYQIASGLLDDEAFEEASALFSALGSYKDSAELLKAAQNGIIGERIVGNWISDDKDLTDDVLEGLKLGLGFSLDEEEVTAFLEYCTFEKFIISMKMEITEGGNIYCSCEKESYDKAIENLVNSVEAGFGDYLMAAMEEALAEEGATLADLEAALGTTVDVDFLLNEALGCTMDELFGAIPQMFDASMFAISGTWEIEDGKIRISTSQATEYGEYDIEKDIFIFTGEGIEDQETLDMLYPMNFTRA